MSLRFLKRNVLGRLEKTELSHQLAHGPWCWPDEIDADVLDVLGVAEPLPKIGVVPLVTVSRTHAALWRFAAFSGGEVATATDLEFGEGARRAFHAAKAAVGRLGLAIPVGVAGIRARRV